MSRMLTRLPDIPEHPLATAWWLVDDPDSHPVWNQYLAAVVSLAEAAGVPPPIRYFPTATHEFTLFALDPRQPVTEEEIPACVQSGYLIPRALHPMNLGYQFSADSDQAAVDRVHHLLNEAPSLDSDWRRWWNDRFEDGQTLVRDVRTGH